LSEISSFAEQSSGVYWHPVIMTMAVAHGSCAEK